MTVEDASTRELHLIYVQARQMAEKLHGMSKAEFDRRYRIVFGERERFDRFVRVSLMSNPAQVEAIRHIFAFVALIESPMQRAEHLDEIAKFWFRSMAMVMAEWDAWQVATRNKTSDQLADDAVKYANALHEPAKT